MKKRQSTSIKYYPLLLLLISVIFIFLTVHIYNSKKRITKVHRLKNYTFNNSSSLDSRIGNIPRDLLAYLKEYDKRDDYSAYTLSREERDTVTASFKLLPPLLQQALNNRLVGLYFVNNFLGSGLTDWVIDEENNFYGYMVFNPEVIKKDLSQVLTWKEQSCFTKETSGFSVHVDCGSEHNGFLYIILHESVHLADYVYQITPYVEHAVLPFLDDIPEKATVTSSIWKDYDTPFQNIPGRDSITFYGFNKGPKISVSKAAALYDNLMTTPFASLYATLNWAEDIAELVSFYHLTEKLRCPYSIIVKHNDRDIRCYQPMKTDNVKSRFKNIDIFYADKT